MVKTPDPELSVRAADAALLDDVLANARSAVPQLPDGLAERMREDALSAMPARAETASDAAPIATQGGFAKWVANLGGWQAMGGLTAALVLGFGLGLAPPDAVETLATDLLGGSAAEQIEDVFWSFDSSLLEG